jgi:hypothetical protein
MVLGSCHGNRARGSTFVLGVLLTSALGCNVFDPSLIDDDGDLGQSSDMEPPTEDMGSTEGLRKVPPRPDVEDGDSVEPVLFALRDVLLNQDGERWREIGLDLDGVDTQLPVPESECVPPDDTAEVPTDGEEGIDNVFGAELFPVVSLAIPDLQQRARENQLSGLGTILLRASEWNGTANDPRVSIELSQAAGGTSADPSTVEFDENHDLVNTADGLEPPAPNWDGNDNFWARDDAFFDGEPLIRDDNAYINDGVVVMRLPDRIDILFFVGDDAGINVQLTDAYAFATLDDEQVDLTTATVAGRWRVIDLINSGDNIGVCQDSAERAIVENQLDKIADVRATPGTGGPGVACDAVSIGVTFTGKRANFIDLGPSRPLPNPCEMP